MRRLLIAALVAAGGAAAAADEPDDALLARLGAAETVRVVVEERYVHDARKRPTRRPIEGFRLPFGTVARDLLRAAGVAVADATAEATLTVTAEGRAIGRLYLDHGPDYLYTGARLEGWIAFAAPGAGAWRTPFSGQAGPPLEIEINLGYERPSAAPFARAFRAPGAYLARLVQVIGRIYGPAPLVAALDHGDAAVRRHAARALGGLGDATAVSPLIAILDDPDPGLRRDAAWSLGRLGDPAAAPALRAALDDADGDVRWFARWALGRIKDGPQAAGTAADGAAGAADARAVD